MSTLWDKNFEAKLAKASYTMRLCHSGDNGKNFEVIAVSGQRLAVSGQTVDIQVGC
ncbi:hypothetical protein H6F76_21055 [Leptolyngbya sp. FACHB-321]|uniref:hypothetical protein n=1 Tax=Leptolyngbya sp. FACHB-321 TaxID=2692807 RepID=UPI0016823C35|nr:hypothetical protein [Leptolyngbya sp. FACHB-321]MBD2037454.1 hypothetical protein [Leptolyngbya sp. FACHB-321]